MERYYSCLHLLSEKIYGEKQNSEDSNRLLNRWDTKSAKDNMLKKAFHTCQIRTCIHSHSLELLVPSNASPLPTKELNTITLAVYVLFFLSTFYCKYYHCFASKLLSYRLKKISIELCLHWILYFIHKIIYRKSDNYIMTSIFSALIIIRIKSMKLFFSLKFIIKQNFCPKMEIEYICLW